MSSRAWNETGRVAPTGSTSLFSMARSSFAWVERESSPISSRKTVPRPAATNKPGVVAVGAGVCAADVAEELVLQQLVGDRRAVDRQKDLRRGRARAHEAPARPAPCRCPTRR